MPHRYQDRWVVGWRPDADPVRHKLGPLVQELGGREAVLREAILAVPRGQKGIFEVSIRLGRHNLTVRGRVVDGVPRLGTFFVP